MTLISERQSSVHFKLKTKSWCHFLSPENINSRIQSMMKSNLEFFGSTKTCIREFKICLASHLLILKNFYCSYTCCMGRLMQLDYLVDIYSGPIVCYDLPYKKIIFAKCQIVFVISILNVWCFQPLDSREQWERETKKVMQAKPYIGGI